jgi:hypothetical protein
MGSSVSPSQIDAAAHEYTVRMREAMHAVGMDTHSATNSRKRMEADSTIADNVLLKASGGETHQNSDSTHFGQQPWSHVALTHRVDDRESKDRAEELVSTAPPHDALVGHHDVEASFTLEESRRAMHLAAEARVKTSVFLQSQSSASTNDRAQMDSLDGPHVGHASDQHHTTAQHLDNAHQSSHDLHSPTLKASRQRPVTARARLERNAYSKRESPIPKSIGERIEWWPGMGPIRVPVNWNDSDMGVYAIPVGVLACHAVPMMHAIDRFSYSPTDRLLTQ